MSESGHLNDVDPRQINQDEDVTSQDSRSTGDVSEVSVSSVKLATTPLAPADGNNNNTCDVSTALVPQPAIKRSMDLEDSSSCDGRFPSKDSNDYDLCFYPNQSSDSTTSPRSASELHRQRHVGLWLVGQVKVTGTDGTFHAGEH